MQKCTNKICNHVQKSPPSNNDAQNTSIHAVAILSDASRLSGVFGIVRFTQTKEGGPTTIKGVIKGLSPGQHGIHIHELGDLSDGCTSAGAHYNPTNSTHGDVNEPNSHIGDLGNITSEIIRDMSGKLTTETDTIVDILADKVSLIGPYSIIGRSLVLHHDPDDLGRGMHDDSLTTGHSGNRVACGVIGLSKAL